MHGVFAPCAMRHVKETTLFKNYLKIAFRNLQKHKTYALINVLGLAVGMTGCLLILLYVQEELGYDRFHRRAERIYRLALAGRATGENRMLSIARSPSPWAPVLAKEFPGVENFVRFKTPLSRWLISNPASQKRFFEKGFYFADASVFEVFDFALLRGNPQEALRQANSVVLTPSAAKKYFGEDDPMGKLLLADNNYEFTVTGVLQEVPHNSHLQFDFLASFATLTVPANAKGEFIYGGNVSEFQNFALNPHIYTYLLLRQDYPPSALERELPAFLQKYAGTALQGAGLELQPFLQPLTAIHLHSHLDAEVSPNSDIEYVYIFIVISLFILLIACINFMNLATARSANRAKEVGLRKVVGSSRSQLVQQFLGESLLLALGAATLAVALGQMLLPWCNELSGKHLAFHFTGGRFLLAWLGVILFAGVLAGSYPALFLSGFRPAAVLKGKFKAGAASATLRRILVIAQFALSIVFIVGTMVVYRQLQYVQNQKLGFDKEHVLTIPLVDPPSRLIYQTYKNAIAQHPNVVSVAAANTVPGGLIDVFMLHAEGMPLAEKTAVEGMFIEHDFIKTLGLELAAGRDFARDFATDTTEAFIINETAAQRFGWNGAALGKQLKANDFFKGRVIGVVKDFHVKSLHQKIEPLALHLAFSPDMFVHLIVRLRPGYLPQTLADLEAKWQEVYPHHPYEYSFLDQDFDSLYRAEQLRGKIFGAFAALAIFIACLGLFGLAAFTAEQRTKEIGIRKVLGATESHLVVLLSQEFVRLVLIANLLAWPLAYGLMHKWLEDFAYRTRLDAGIFLWCGLATLVISLLTVSFQALRAALANPVEALRYE